MSNTKKPSLHIIQGGLSEIVDFSKKKISTDNEVEEEKKKLKFYRLLLHNSRDKIRSDFDSTGILNEESIDYRFYMSILARIKYLELSVEDVEGMKRINSLCKSVMGLFLEKGDDAG